MSYVEQNRDAMSGMRAAWAGLMDPTPYFEEMSEKMGIGEWSNLFQAMAAMQTEALRIAVHAPFVPFHVYAQIVKVDTPITMMAEAAEEAATHVVETMNHNTEVLQQEAEKVADTVTATVQKSASPKAKTASGPIAGSGA